MKGTIFPFVIVILGIVILLVILMIIITGGIIPFKNWAVETIKSMLGVLIPF